MIVKEELPETDDDELVTQNLLEILKGLRKEIGEKHQEIMRMAAESERRV